MDANDRCAMMLTAIDVNVPAALKAVFAISPSRISLANKGMHNAASVRELAQHLAEDSQLRILSLDGNPAIGQHAALLANALRVNRRNRLEQLSLPGTGLGPEPCAALAELLGQNTTLKQLDLSNNAIGSVGFRKLVDALLANPASGLQMLNVSRNQISDVDFPRVEAVLQRLERLEINLLHNPVKSPYKSQQSAAAAAPAPAPARQAAPPPNAANLVAPAVAGSGPPHQQQQVPARTAPSGSDTDGGGPPAPAWFTSSSTAFLGTVVVPQPQPATAAPATSGPATEARSDTQTRSRSAAMACLCSAAIAASFAAAAAHVGTSVRRSGSVQRVGRRQASPASSSASSSPSRSVSLRATAPLAPKAAAETHESLSSSDSEALPTPPAEPLKRPSVSAAPAPAAPRTPPSPSPVPGKKTPEPERALTPETADPESPPRLPPTPPEAVPAVTLLPSPAARKKKARPSSKQADGLSAPERVECRPKPKARAKNGTVSPKAAAEDSVTKSPKQPSPEPSLTTASSLGVFAATAPVSDPHTIIPSVVPPVQQAPPPYPGSSPPSVGVHSAAAVPAIAPIVVAAGLPLPAAWAGSMGPSTNSPVLRVEEFNMVVSKLAQQIRDRDDEIRRLQQRDSEVSFQLTLMRQQLADATSAAEARQAEHDHVFSSQERELVDRARSRATSAEERVAAMDALVLLLRTECAALRQALHSAQRQVRQLGQQRDELHGHNEQLRAQLHRTFLPNSAAESAALLNFTDNWQRLQALSPSPTPAVPPELQQRLDQVDRVLGALSDKVAELDRRDKDTEGQIYTKYLQQFHSPLLHASLRQSSPIRARATEMTPATSDGMVPEVPSTSDVATSVSRGLFSVRKEHPKAVHVSPTVSEPPHRARKSLATNSVEGLYQPLAQPRRGQEARSPVRRTRRKSVEK